MISLRKSYSVICVLRCEFIMLHLRKRCKFFERQALVWVSNHENYHNFLRRSIVQSTLGYPPFSLSAIKTIGTDFRSIVRNTRLCANIFLVSIVADNRELTIHMNSNCAQTTALIERIAFHGSLVIWRHDFHAPTRPHTSMTAIVQCRSSSQDKRREQPIVGAGPPAIEILKASRRGG